MNQYRTMGDVRLAANEYGMTLEQFFFESSPELFEGVDWSDERPSESVDDRLERIKDEMNILMKYGYEIPDRLLTEYHKALDEWVTLASEEWERVKEAMENAPIGDIDDYATEEDIQL